MMVKINPFEDTPEDKEQYIAEMLQQRYSYKQIMTKWHVSPNTIVAVKNKFFGSSDNEKLIQASKTSKESQAFRLFQQGKSVVEVKIELDIASSDAALFYEKYLELSSFHNFNIAYKEVKGQIGSFLQLFNATKTQGMSDQQVSAMVSYGSRLPQLQTMHSKLSSEIHALEREKMGLDCHVQLMADQKEHDMAELKYLQYQCDIKKKELLQLDLDINSKKAFIQNFDNDEGYIRIKKAAAEQINCFLRENRLLLASSLSATLEGIRKYPEKQQLVFDLITCQDYPTGAWMNSHGARLLQLTEQAHSEIMQGMTQQAISSVQVTDSNSKVPLT